MCLQDLLHFDICVWPIVFFNFYEIFWWDYILCVYQLQRDHFIGKYGYCRHLLPLSWILCAYIMYLCAYLIFLCGLSSFSTSTKYFDKTTFFRARGRERLGTRLTFYVHISCRDIMFIGKYGYCRPLLQLSWVCVTGLCVEIPLEGYSTYHASSE